MTRYLPSLPPALGYPLYRAYWMGTLASVSGFQIVRFAQFWLMYQLTESPLAVVGFAAGPATINSKVRNLGASLRRLESAVAASAPASDPA